MKLSPEDVGSLAARFTDRHAEKLADEVDGLVGGTMSDQNYGKLRDGLQDAVANLLGSLEFPAQ